jgi:diaminohydroxyphosphoribosylaminopyrimidine deaminase/5-amino-6-(5-phosphoribosylamino)uracil reductase
MTISEKYMALCIELAKKGSGNVSPNPMVGCVIVHQNSIIGQGYHENYGGPHAEVNAIHSVKDKTLLTESTLYVNLEPCAHYGLTPPCSDLIIQHQIPRVVIGSIDPFAKVAGKGIARLQNAGCHLDIGVLQNKCDQLNKRFFTFHKNKRPYIILKWAQTTDGFIDILRERKDFGKPTRITGKEALLSVHRLRAKEDAILVGSNTAEKDNPSLTVRHCEGNNPLRVVIDRQLRLPKTLGLYDNSSPTLVFNAFKSENEHLTSYQKIDFSKNVLQQILDVLYQKKILSVIVEGGSKTLRSFIDANLWDEAHLYTGTINFKQGITAPEIGGKLLYTKKLGNDKLSVFQNNNQN